MHFPGERVSSILSGVCDPGKVNSMALLGSQVSVTFCCLSLEFRVSVSGALVFSVSTFLLPTLRRALVPTVASSLPADPWAPALTLPILIVHLLLV